MGQRTEQATLIATVLGLFVACCTCIAAYLAVPQAQSFINGLLPSVTSSTPGTTNTLTVIPTSATKKLYKGRVTDSITGKPIQGAKVTLETPGVPPITYTDSDGLFIFSFDAIQAGTPTRIYVEANNYQTVDRNISLQDNKAEEIHLQPK